MNESRAAALDGLIWGAMLTLVFGGPPAFAVAGSTHPWGVGGYAGGLISIGAWVPMATLPVLLLGLFLVTTRGSRALGITVLAATLCVALGTTALSGVAGLVRDVGLERHTRRDLDPIVTAIEQFTTDRGHPPRTLDALTPRYLSKRPSRSLRLEYELRADDTTRRDHAWILTAAPPFELPDHGALIYTPSNEYEPHPGERDVERIGDWFVERD